MEPYDKKGRKSKLPLWLMALGGLVLALVLAFGAWLALRSPAKPPLDDARLDEGGAPKSAVELPAPSEEPATKKESAAPQKPLSPPAAPSNPVEAAKHIDAAVKLFSEEKHAACREECWNALKDLNEDDALWGKAVELLGKASMIIFMTDVRAPEKVLHHVKAGDSLLKIAIDNNTTMEALQKANGIPENEKTIHPGQTLSIYKGEWKIKVCKSRYKLYVYDHDRLFKVYAVGIGRQDRTPPGTFELGVKQRDPAWYNKGKKYDFGSPENILGSRWMALTATGTTSPDLKGYGIHGTNDPSNVGKPTSNGCVRMRNEDINELFAVTPMKTPVEIVE